MAEINKKILGIVVFSAFLALLGGWLIAGAIASHQEKKHLKEIEDLQAKLQSASNKVSVIQNSTENLTLIAEAANLKSELYLMNKSLDESKNYWKNYYDSFRGGGSGGGGSSGGY